VIDSVSDAAKATLLRGGERCLLRVESAFGVRIQSRNPGFSIEGGDREAQRRSTAVLAEMVRIAEQTGDLDEYMVDLLVAAQLGEAPRGEVGRPILYDARGQAVLPRSPGQHRLVEAVRANELVFAIGPAGTGKTYLAIAMAVAALQRREVDRLVLVRPAVEAGEELGFLPGDLIEKIAPYLQPMTDALQELLPRARYKECMEAGLIEMAPLAYMRGRTLKRCFVILDEAQNATVPQMRMFLTRLGVGSRAVVTGDPTQVDLPTKTRSGFEDACGILAEIRGIAQVRLQSKDQMRHPLVQAIIDAYDSRSSTHGD
jgi:phosphate starvation-inducible protein PhoH and related proteins